MVRFSQNDVENTTIKRVYQVYDLNENLIGLEVWIRDEDNYNYKVVIPSIFFPEGFNVLEFINIYNLVSSYLVRFVNKRPALRQRDLIKIKMDIEKQTLTFSEDINEFKTWFVDSLDLNIIE